MRAVVRTPAGKLWAYRDATAAVDTVGTLVVRDTDGWRYTGSGTPNRSTCGPMTMSAGDAPGP